MVKVKWFEHSREKKAGVLEDGYGTFNWPSGSTYIGEWKYGKAEGLEFSIGLMEKSLLENT